MPWQSSGHSGDGANFAQNIKLKDIILNYTKHNNNKHFMLQTY